MYKNTIRSARKADAIFIGWQETSWGEVLALYNITVTGHPSYGSTVTDTELRKMHLRIPKSSLSHRRVKKSYSLQKNTH
jgi:hypothetical protein